jgi:hypothetical protein
LKRNRKSKAVDPEAADGEIAAPAAKRPKLDAKQVNTHSDPFVISRAVNILVVFQNCLHQQSIDFHCLCPIAWVILNVIELGMMQATSSVVEDGFEFSRVKMGIGASPGQMKKKKPSKEKLLVQVFTLSVKSYCATID